MPDRILLGRWDQPDEGSAVVLHFAHHSEVHARLNYSGSPWLSVEDGMHRTWEQLLQRAPGKTNGPFLLTDSNGDAYRRGWREGRLDLHYAITSHIEGLALDPPADGGV